MENLSFLSAKQIRAQYQQSPCSQFQEDILVLDISK
jgi:hypothetical protein